MRKTRGLFGIVARLFFGRKETAARQYLTSLHLTDDPMALLRQRAEDADLLMRNEVFQETIQRMNENLVSEIVSGGMLDDQMRSMLYLKLQLVTDFQDTLMTHISEYETMAVIREAERRQEEDSDAPWPQNVR